MRVCLLGERGDKHDEGMKNMSMRLERHLAAYVDDVTLLDLRDVTSAGFWTRLHSLSVDVIHLIPGPTPHGLVFLSILGQWKGAKTIATTTQPRHVDVFPHLPTAFRPDRLLAQSASLRDRFEAAGYATGFIPSGVDLDKFSTVSADDRRALRRQLDLPVDERLFLHVGHFKEGRDVFDLLSLQQFGEVIVIGSPSTGPETDVVDALREAGCHVLTDYIERIEQYYQTADVYVFPTRNEEHSIQAPLSVFEAMACGCPVVTTDFGGLKDCFEPGDGLRFVNSIADVSREDITFDSPDTREKVRPYSWDRIAERTAENYAEL